MLLLAIWNKRNSFVFFNLKNIMPHPKLVLNVFYLKYTIFITEQPYLYMWDIPHVALQTLFFGKIILFSCSNCMIKWSYGNCFILHIPVLLHHWLAQKWLSDSGRPMALFPLHVSPGNLFKDRYSGLVRILWKSSVYRIPSYSE